MRVVRAVGFLAAGVLVVVIGMGLALALAGDPGWIPFSPLREALEEWGGCAWILGGSIGGCLWGYPSTY